MAWWDDGLLFSCIGCGRCCRGEPGAIYLARGEEERLAAHFSQTPEEFRRRNVTGRWGRPSLREKKGGACVLHDPETGKCRAYGIRPLQCSLFPFWPSLLSSREEWEKAAAGCPGMNSGKFHPAEEVRELLLRCPFPSLL